MSRERTPDSSAPSDEVPQGRVRRTAKVSAAVGTGGARVAGTVAANVFRGDERAAELLMERHLEAAERMAKTLGTMKGAAMKLGQLASFVEVEFIPPEFRPLYHDALATLRDAAPPVSWKAAERVLREEWDETPSAILADVEESPAAAASVGQVHRAKLRDGREVALKIQYPGVAEAIRADLQNARVLTSLAKAIAPQLDARAIAKEVSERVLEELDYELEAQNQRRFARQYRGHPFVVIPDVDTDLSRERVLVSEWVDGRGFDEVKRGSQEERNWLGEVIDRFFYGAMHRVGAFNSDPHPGNYLVLEGRVAFLDFGSVKNVTRERLDQAARLFLAAADGDADTAHRQMVEMGYLAKPDKIKAERLLEVIHLTRGWLLFDREFEITPEYVLDQVMATSDPRKGYFDVMRAASIPAEDALFYRLDAGIVSVLAQLRACANWGRIARELWINAEPVSDLGRAEREFWTRA